jgi:hypothetical protein
MTKPKRVTLIAAAIVFLSSAGCFNGAWDLRGAGSCSDEVLADVPAPGGALHAYKVRYKCERAPEAMMVSVGKTWNAHGGFVFSGWSQGESQGPPDVTISWRSPSEVVIAHPAGSTFTCFGRAEQVTVHCVEQSLAAEAKH